MTVSEAIINWLETFSIDSQRKLKCIDTDIQSTTVESYSLVKEPVQNIKTYISGKKNYTDYYMIQARLASQTDSERMENNSFGEALEEWVRKQNNEKVFPVIEDAMVHGITVTTPFFMGKTETNNSIYQMTIAVKYIKEK